MSILYLSKCAPSTPQLNDRKNKQAKGLELHLYEHQLSNIDEVDTITNDILNTDINVYVVHSPHGRDYCLEALGQERGRQRLDHVSLLASKMHDIHKQPVYIVIHLELCMDQIHRFGL